jgi:hypothetical protein
VLRDDGLSLRSKHARTTFVGVGGELREFRAAEQSTFTAREPSVYGLISRRSARYFLRWFFLEVGAIQRR